MSQDDAQLKLIRSQTADGASDINDHGISLVDTTAPVEFDDESRARSISPGGSTLAKKQTRGTIREQLARRKYAKWQEEKYSSKRGGVRGNGVEDHETPTSDLRSPKSAESGRALESETADFAHPTEENRGRKGKSPKPHRRQRQEPYEIDILYENQRGWFFFGIPLYSHSSLLNFDPSPWVTKDFKDSAVNITNAQVPDPSWVWAWRTWYVDMSYDVDEEGWQYSFNFGRSFAWHGTHPWFHSFVRRRRWLRKRVKKHDAAGEDKVNAAHKLTGDYFTIHPKRGRSPHSVTADPVKAARPSSYISMRTSTDADEPPEDIRSVPDLLKALRIAKVDREKISAVKKFVDEGGDELAYLEDRIPEIMSFLIFQNSRRQLLSYLKGTAQDAQKHRDEHDAEDRPEGEAESRRINNLLSAVAAADKEIRGLEYWSDRKHVLKTTDDSSGHSGKAQGDPRPRSHLDNDPVGDIKGISEDAEVEVDLPPQHSDGGEAGSDKGKGKAIDQKGDPKDERDQSPRRLEYDSILVPDEN